MSIEEFRASVLRVVLRMVDEREWGEEAYVMLREVGFTEEEIFPPTHAVVRVTREFLVPLVDARYVPPIDQVQRSVRGQLDCAPLRFDDYDVVRVTRAE